VTDNATFLHAIAQKLQNAQSWNFGMQVKEWHGSRSGRNTAGAGIIFVVQLW